MERLPFEVQLIIYRYEHVYKFVNNILPSLSYSTITLRSQYNLASASGHISRCGPCKTLCKVNSWIFNKTHPIYCTLCWVRYTKLWIDDLKYSK